MAKRIDDALVQNAICEVGNGERFDTIASKKSLDPRALEGALVAYWRRKFPKEVRISSDTQRAHIHWLVEQHHWSWARACEPYNVDPEAEEQLHIAVKPSQPCDPVPPLPVRIISLASQPFARLTLAERAELDRALVPDGQRNSADGHLTIRTTMGEVVIWRADLDQDTLATIGAAFFPAVATRRALVAITTQVFADAARHVNRGVRRGKLPVRDLGSTVAKTEGLQVLEEQVSRLFSWARGVRALWKRLFPNGSRSADGSLLDENKTPVWVSGIGPGKIRKIAGHFFPGIDDVDARMAIAAAVIRAIYECPSKNSTGKKTLNRRVNLAVEYTKREDLRDSIALMICWLATGGPEA